MQRIYNTFTVPCEISKTVSFASSVMKNIVPPAARSKFAVKLICWVSLGPASRAYCLRKSIAINLQFSLK